MKKTVKILLWTVGVLLVLLLAATLVLKLYLTKERILTWVIPPLEEKLHRTVSVADAGAGLTGIHLDGLDVRSTGAKEPSVSARGIKIRWNLLSLLRAKLEVGEVLLVEPRIYVIRLPNGALDIDDLMRPKEAAKKTEKTEKGGKAGLLTVSLFSIDNGRVSFEDRTKTPVRTYTLDAIDARVREIAFDRPVPFMLSARLPVAKAGRFSAEGRADPTSRAVTARIRVADFDLPSLNPLLKGSTRFASGVYGLDFNLALADKAQGDLKGTMKISKLALVSREQVGKTADIEVLIDATADPAKGIATLRQCRIEMAGQQLSLTGEAKGLKARPHLRFQAESPQFQLSALTGLLPPKGKQTTSGEGPTAAEGGKRSRKATRIPLDALGDIRVGRLLAKGLVVQDFAARIELEQGVLKLQPVGGSLYGGKVQGRVLAELMGMGPPFDSNLALKAIQVGELLAGLSPKLQGVMTGTLDFALDAQGRGGDLAALRSTLHAEAKDGKLVNHPMVQKLAEMFQVKELETLKYYTFTADAETGEGVARLSALTFHGPNFQATGKGKVGLVDQNLDIQLTAGVPRKLAEKLVKDPKTLSAITDEKGWSVLPLRLAGKLDKPSYGFDLEALTARIVGDKATKALEGKVLKKLPATQEEKKTIEEGLKKILGR